MTSDPDLARLLAALEKQRVAFVVVGSVAAMALGAPAEPDDLDVVPATDRENLERLSRGLAELDARPIAEAGRWERDPFDQAEGATWFRLGPDAELHVYAADDPDHAFFTNRGATFARRMARCSR